MSGNNHAALAVRLALGRVDSLQRRIDQLRERLIAVRPPASPPSVQQDTAEIEALSVEIPDQTPISPHINWNARRSEIVSSGVLASCKSIDILATPHSLYLAEACRRAFESFGLQSSIFTKAPERCKTDGLYLVICPQMFETLPPPEQRICVQMEPSVSLRWLTPSYLDILRNSLAVIDCSRENLPLLEQNGICYPQTFHIPVAGISNSNEGFTRESEIKFRFSVGRLLFALGILPYEAMTPFRNLPDLAAPYLVLSLPETTRRREFAVENKRKNAVLFEGLRHSPGWVGAAYSYKFLAQAALHRGAQRMIVQEDDAEFPEDFNRRFEIVRSWLDENPDWDVFSGFIGDAHDDTKVISVFEHQGVIFVEIDRTVSLVFNVYHRRAIELLAQWEHKNDNIMETTIDRVLERMPHCRVLTTLPFLVGHREQLTSSVWGVDNAVMSNMIYFSERRLFQKALEFQLRTIEKPGSGPDATV